MSVTAYLTRQIQIGTDVQTSVETLTTDMSVTVSESVPASSSVVLTVSQVKNDLECMYASVDIDSTKLITNYGTTFTCMSGIPILFSLLQPSGSNPLTSNLSSITAVNPSTDTACNVEIRFLSVS